MLSVRLIEWIETLDGGKPFQSVWEQLPAHFGYEAVRVFELHEGAGEVAFSAGKPISGGNLASTVSIFNHGVLGSAVRDGRLLEVRDYARHEAALEDRKEEIKSLLVMPLRHAGSVIGALVLVNTEHHRPKLNRQELQELRILQSVFSAHMAVRRIERRVSRHRGLLAFTSKIHSVSRIEQLVPMLFKSMSEHLKYAALSLALLEGDVFRIYYAVGEKSSAPELVGEEIRPVDEAPLTRHIIHTSEPILIGDVMDPVVRAFYPIGALNIDPEDDVDIRSYAGTHLKYGELQGVLSVQSTEPWSYGLSELEYLVSLAEAMAYGLERVRWRALDQSADRLRRIDWEDEDVEGITAQVLAILEDLWRCRDGAVYVGSSADYRRTAACKGSTLALQLQVETFIDDEPRIYRSRTEVPVSIRELWSQGTAAALSLPIPDGFVWIASDRKMTEWDLRLANSLARELDPYFRRLQRHVRLRNEAALDPLTGVYNRRKLDERLQRMISLASRYGDTFTVVVVDMLNFGEVNNRHGHLVGDRVLARAARVLKESMREGDDVFRMGGDEFVILLRRTSKKEAVKVAMRCAEALAGDAMLEQYRVQANFGLAEYREGETPDSLLEAADREMYAAKARKVSVLGVPTD